jgi:CRISPR/Cas system-associated exonuclease Cas4 (RecB family)
MEQIRISGKNLGEVAMPGFCPRCFWIRLHSQKLPYQVFPGIFSSIDSYSKKITNLHYESHETVPVWLETFGRVERPVKVPHHSKFFVVDKETNVMLTGAPDEILQMADASYFIVDYKTSRFTKHQDRLLPLYEVQLNSYAYIAERTGLSPVSGIGLVYYEPVTDISVDDVSRHTLKDGFSMHYTAKALPLELKTGWIRPLLRKAREIYDLGLPPVNSQCRDCGAIDEMMSLIK